MTVKEIVKENLDIDIIESLPIKKEFIDLYKEATSEWSSQGLYTYDELYRAICNSWYYVSIYHDTRLIGFGRIISDGIYQTLICDVMVLPEYQNHGVGAKIMETLLNKCDEKGIKWVQLLSAGGKQGFYEKFGFTARDAGSPGMTLFFDN